MQMPTINLLDATATVFQFLLVLMLLFAVMFIIALMFRGFFSVLSGIVVLPKSYKESRIDTENQNYPRQSNQPIFSFREGEEIHRWQSY